MTADEYIQFARMLVARFSSDEAAQRTAVSRAYYGAYHLAAELLRPLSIGPLNYGTIPRFLMQSAVPAAQNAGRVLGNLQSDRIKADYRLDTTITVQFATTNVERAHEIRTFLAAFESPDAAAPLATGIRAYIDRISGGPREASS